MEDENVIIAYQDDFMAVTAFQGLLDALDAHKQKRLNDIVRFALVNAHFANALIDALLQCIDDNKDQENHQKRLILLLLVDRLMKQSNEKMNKASTTPDCAVFVERLASELDQVVEKLVPGPDVLATTVRKMVQGWKKSLSNQYEQHKSPFDEAETYAKTQESLSASLSIPEDTHHLLNSLFKPQAQRGGIGGGADDHKREHAEIQRKIEEDRDRHKRIREESWVRPDFPDPYSEGEWWNNASDGKTGIVLSNVERGPGQIEFADLWTADVNILKSSFWDQLVVEATRAKADLDNDPPHSNSFVGIGGVRMSTQRSGSASTPMTE